jgi:predicted permease
LVNRAIVLDDVPRTVIGILPRNAWLFAEDSFIVPAVLQPGTPRAARSPHWAVVFGRLKPGVTLAAADAELKSIKRQLSAEYPAFKADWGVGVQPLSELLAKASRPALYILLGAVSLVLLIACANVANLLLARACRRDQEMAVRTALGASGARLVRQTLTESLVLAVAGGVAGLAVTWWGVELLRYLTADLLPQAVTPRMDVRVLVFATLVTALTGLLFGTFPALRAKRVRLNDTLKDGGRGATVGGHRRMQSALIIAEVGLTAVLLSSAGLLLRSLANTATVDPGFAPAQVLAFDVSLPNVTYDTNEKRLSFTTTLLERLRGLPGVEAAGAGRAIPFTDGGSGEYFRRADLPADQAGRSFVLGRLDFVSPGYLEALGAQWRAGRAIADADNRVDAPRIAVINETAARTIFPNGDAVGQRIAIAAQTWLVVGVVGDMAQQRLDAPQRLFAWVPQAFNTGLASIAVRTGQSPLALIAPIRDEVRRLDAGVAIANARALDRALAASMSSRRLVLILVGGFAIAAVALASIGLSGVMAYSVATRRREISIRLALGAVPGDVVRAILRDGLRLTTIGLAAGIVASLGAAELLRSELYRVEAYDPWVAASTMIVLLLVAMLACWVPARGATRVNPIAALRNE